MGVADHLDKFEKMINNYEDPHKKIKYHAHKGWRRGGGGSYAQSFHLNYICFVLVIDGK